MHAHLIVYITATILEMTATLLTILIVIIVAITALPTSQRTDEEAHIFLFISSFRGVTFSHLTNDGSVVSDAHFSTHFKISILIILSSFMKYRERMYKCKLFVTENLANVDKENSVF